MYITSKIIPAFCFPARCLPALCCALICSAGNVAAQKFSEPQCFADIERPYGEVGVMDMQTVLSFMGTTGRLLKIGIKRGADLTEDGVIDGSDLTLLLAHWGPCPRNCPMDLNRDGQVSAVDLTYLLSRTPPPTGSELVQLFSAWGPCPRRGAANRALSGSSPLRPSSTK